MRTVEMTCRTAKENAGAVAFASEQDMNAMLYAAASALRARSKEIIGVNSLDVRDCTRGEQFRERMLLTESRIEGMAAGIEKIAELPCPLGEILEERTMYNGILLRRVRVPVGTVGIIYESRPNVTADVIGLCIKSGNAVVLRGSRDTLRSNTVICTVIKDAIREAGYNPEFIQLIEDPSDEGAKKFMPMNGVIDLLIPRGGAALIQNAVKNATVPIIETGTGNCHVYFEKTADIGKGIPVLINAKTQRTSVCNACESVLIDEAIAGKSLPSIAEALLAKGVRIYACERSREIKPGLEPATEEDYAREYLDMQISMKVVSGLDEAIAHINRYGTHHSDAILTEDPAAAERFLNEVDSAAVYVNASTRFTDGFEFGMGAELGISTQKLHARGPMGLKEMTTYKYQLRGDGQVRG